MPKFNPDIQVCAHCDTPYAQWTPGPCIIDAHDNRGLCPECKTTMEATGATVDVQWFPNAFVHVKPEGPA